MNFSAILSKFKKLYFVLGFIDIIYFIFIMTFKGIFFDYMVRDTYFSARDVFLPVFATVLFFVGISLFFKAKKRCLVLYIFNFIISVLTFADIVYYRYYRDVLSINVLRNGVMLGAVKSSVTSLFSPSDIIFLIDLIILPKFFYMIIKKVTADYNIKFRFRKSAVFASIIIVSGILLDTFCIHNLAASQPNLLTTMYNRIYVVRNIGGFNFHTVDTYNYVRGVIKKNQALPSAREDDIKKYFTSKVAAQVSGKVSTDTNSSPVNTMTSSDGGIKISSSKIKGTGSGKNLIVIQVEALQQFVIGQKIQGNEITPNLNRWIKKSTYLDNCYYQVSGGNTSDAEFMLNNSLYPASEGAACYLYCDDYFDSLPKSLEKKGYEANVMHGFKESFWNRNVMNKAEGFNNFYGETSYKLNETIGMGLSDKQFFSQSLVKMKTFKQPYYSFMITLSSHFPFVDDKYPAFDTGKYNGRFLGDYMRAIHYADEELGYFLDSLEKNGTLDNSIVMLYGDHYAIPDKEKSDLYSFLGNTHNVESSWTKLQKVPLLIHFPHDENSCVVHTVCGEMDLYPTISNIFGLNKQYTLGNDIFGNNAGHEVFRNGSFINNNIYYSSSSDKYYNLDTDKQIQETNELKALKHNTALQLEYSDDILNHNLLKNFTK